MPPKGYKKQICKRGHDTSIHGRNSQNHCKKCHALCNWSAELKYKYGITKEDYNKLFKEQNGKCAICGKHQIDLNVRLCVDHNHLTGAIRGLLCMKCNYSLGHYESIKEKAEFYLRSR